MHGVFSTPEISSKSSKSPSVPFPMLEQKENERNNGENNDKI